MLKAIVFDLDDTLYPERQYALSGFAAVAEYGQQELGIPQDRGYAELEKYFNDGVRGDTFNRWLESHGVDSDEWVPKLIKCYRDHTPRLQAFPETYPLLDRLRRTYRLGLITQGYRRGQQRKIEALRLAEYFEAILIMGEDEKANWKPSAMPFERLLMQMEVDGNQASYIGDNPLKDFRGARELGMLTIWIRRDMGEHSDDVPPGPDFEAEIELKDLSQVEATLEQRA